MKNPLIFLLPVLFLSACANQKSISKTAGIFGEVRWVEGNIMPSIGDTTYASRAKGVPIEREIFIYQATKISDARRSEGNFYKSITSQLVKKVKSKKDGTFRAILPAGKYSVFVREKDGLFANIFDGDNYINPVTVQANNFTEIKIMVNYKAFY
jgi:hypothetical protein